MALPDFPVVDDLIKQLSTVSYSDVKAGHEALARVAQKAPKAEQVRQALSILGEQLNLPLTRYQPAPMTATGGGGGMMPPSGPPVGTAAASPMNDPRMIRAQGAMVRRVAPEIARYIEAGKTPAQAARMVIEGPLGRTMNSLSDVFNRAGFRHPINTTARVLQSPDAQRALPAARQVGQIAAGAGGAGAATAAAAESAGLGGMGAKLAAAVPALAPVLLTAGLTAKAVKDLADTQDPMEQMRYMERTLNKKLTARDLDMGEVSGKFTQYQLEQLRDEGVVDDSVVNAYRAPGDERIPDYDAQAAPAPAAPAKPAAAARPAGRPAATAQGPRVLRRGDRSEETKNLQSKLIGLDYDLGEDGADGIFGPNTEKAVKQFQKDHGLAVDGAVGKNTYAALTKVTAPAAAAGETSGFKVYLGEGVTPTTEDPRPGSISRGIKTSPVRFNMSEFSDENIDEAVGDPIAPPTSGGDRDAPTENAQAYLDFGLDEEVRPSAFPLFRRRRNRK